MIKTKTRRGLSKGWEPTQSYKELRMRSLKLLVGVVFSGALLLTAAAVSAKGPGGGGASTHTPGTPEGKGHGVTSTTPSGLNQGDKTGWDGGTVAPGGANGGQTGGGPGA